MVALGVVIYYMYIIHNTCFIQHELGNLLVHELSPLGAGGDNLKLFTKIIFDE